MKIDQLKTLKTAIVEGGSTLAPQFDPKERAQYLNASEADSCIRHQWYSKRDGRQGITRRTDNGFSKRGHHMEKYVIDALKAGGLPVFFTGGNQIKLIHEGHKVAATPDGLIDYEDGVNRFGLEIKSIDPRTNMKNLPKQQHVTQLQLTMDLWDHQEGYSISRGYLIYVNASDYDDIHIFEVERREEGFVESYAARSKKVRTTKNVAGLDREGKRNDFGKECKTCEYAEECGVDVVGSKGTRAAGNSALTSHVRALRDQKVEEKAVKGRIAELAESVKAELRKRKKNTLKVDGEPVTLTEAAGRKSLDRVALAKALKKGHKIEDYEKVGKPSERLTV